MNHFSSDLNHVDLAFVVDTTGSMGAFINAARAQMIGILQGLVAAAAVPVDLSVGLVEYRDHPPQDTTFVTRVHAFARDLRRVQKAIEKLSPAGGGDEPEAVYDGLQAARDELVWREHAHRLMVLVGDAPPHGATRGGDAFPGGCPCGLTPDSVTAALEARSITLYALGLTRGVEESFTRLARYTGGEYFPAARGDAALEALRAVLAREFGELEFDHQVYEWYVRQGVAGVDALAAKLETGRGRVSSSLSRLGRRGLLQG